MIETLSEHYPVTAGRACPAKRFGHNAPTERFFRSLKSDDDMDAGGRATQDAYMDIGGTTTRKWEVELRLEQQPRATQDAYMDIGGRATQEQLPSSCRDG